MPFVNEKMIPPKYLKKYSEQLGAEKLRDCEGWTIDYENEFFIAPYPHGYMELHDLLLFIVYWDKHFFHLKVYRDINRDIEPLKINYHTLRFELPIELEEQRPLFLQDLKAALVAYGTYGAWTGVKNIVTFNLKEV